MLCVCTCVREGGGGDGGVHVVSLQALPNSYHTTMTLTLTLTLTMTLTLTHDNATQVTASALSVYLAAFGLEGSHIIGLCCVHLVRVAA